ncbi:MAG: hypothetical protein AB7F59_12665 [Bdellovibrionales bacterium]
MIPYSRQERHIFKKMQAIEDMVLIWLFATFFFVAYLYPDLVVLRPKNRPIPLLIQKDLNLTIPMETQQVSKIKNPPLKTHEIISPELAMKIKELARRADKINELVRQMGVP